MHAFRASRARRVPALIACLALFIMGSNYCMLSAWGGNADMACLSLPKATAPAPAAVAATCGHCLPASQTAESTTADAEPAGSSCCPAPVVTPSGPTLDRDQAVASVLFNAVLAEPALHPASAWHGHRALPDGRPPTRLARAPLPARAPPLA
jgi:hypothetical protein